MDTATKPFYSILTLNLTGRACNSNGDATLASNGGLIHVGLPLLISKVHCRAGQCPQGILDECAAHAGLHSKGYSLASGIETPRYAFAGIVVGYSAFGSSHRIAWLPVQVVFQI
jgi:hypothetical protein